MDIIVPLSIRVFGRQCEYIFSDILSKEARLSKGIVVTRQQAAEPIEY